MMELVSLALATLAFVGTHLALSHPLRLRVIGAVGDQLFLLVYSLVAAVTLLWMILAYAGVDNSAPLWIAPDWWWWAASGVMLFASILLVGSFVKNPAFPHPGIRGKLQPARPVSGVFAITRHPMNWSFALWALVHISLSWSPRNLIVAIGILVLAIAGSIGQDRKKRSIVGQNWVDYERRTSFVPFAALAARALPWRSAFPGWIALGGGLAFWLVATWLHAPEVSPLATLTGAGLD
jgi:uncharacterized membrane protein